MRRAFPILMLCLCLSACAGSQTRAQPPSHAGKLTALSWMEGSWAGTSAQGDVDEHWSMPSGRTMLGMGRAIAEGKTRFFEFMSVEDREGVVVFTAWPRGKNPTEFKLTRLEEREAVFENPEHDFPQTIVYTLEPDGLLHARAQGRVAGELKVEQYWLKRVR